MVFTTLNSIVSDLLKIIRGSSVSQSETISNRQLEEWVHQYRSLLLKRDLDKGKTPNPDYIQEISAIKLVKEDITGDDNSLNLGEYVYRTSVQIPKTIDLNFKSGILYIGTLDDKQIPLVSYQRSQWQEYRTYTNTDRIAYLKNRYIYIKNDNGLSYIKIRGVFEVPSELNSMINPVTTKVCYSTDSPYPIPNNLLPTLKELILKNELGIMIQSPSDNKNDSNNKVEPNIKQQL
jgi:hypothetical protein